MKQEFKENFPWYFVTKIVMPILLFGITAIFLERSARENQILESYFRDTASLINSEFAFDESADKLADDCRELENKLKDTKLKAQDRQKLKELHQTKKCDQPIRYLPQTNIVRNTVGARTILVLDQLPDKKNRKRIKKFVQTSGISCWIDPEPTAKTTEKYEMLKNTYDIECESWKPKPKITKF